MLISEPIEFKSHAELFEALGGRLKEMIRSGEAAPEKATEYVLRLRKEIEALKTRKDLVFKPTTKRHLLSAYLLGLSATDPVKEEIPLVYIGTPNLPDIDTDISSESQSLAEQYLKEKYGDKKVLHVPTYLTYKGKSAVRDVVKTLGATHRQASAMLELSQADDVGTVLEDVEKNMMKLRPAEREWVDANWEIVKRVSLKLEGCIRGLGSHSAGSIVSDDDIDKQLPCMNTKTGIKAAFSEGLGERVLSDLGFVKYDFLGLKTLAIIKTMQEMLEGNYIAPDINDPAIYEEFGEGNTDFIFQFSSDQMKKILRGVHPRDIRDLAACNALYRPASIKYVKDFVEDSTPSIDPTLNDILGESRNIMIYQEQTLQIFKDLGGFSLLEAENARKAIKLVAVPNPSKVALDKFKKIVEKFKKGCEKRGVPENVQHVVLEAIKESSSYSFNKCLDGNTTVYKLDANSRPALVPISTITPDDYVLAYDRHLKSCLWARVIKVYQSKADLYTYTTSVGRSLTCSQEHKLLTDDGLERAVDIWTNKKIIHTYQHDADTAVEEYISDVALAGYNKDAWDLEIDHPDHVFIANESIIVSNSHSVSYALLAAETMFYKIYYPLHFYLATLQHLDKPEDEPERKLAVKKLQEMGYKLTLGNINDYTVQFKVDTASRVLYLPVTLLKNVRKNSAAALQQLQPFADIDDLFEKAKKQCDKRTMEMFIAAGLLDCYGRPLVEEKFRAAYKVKQDEEIEDSNLFKLLGFELVDTSDKTRELFKTLRSKNNSMVDLATAKKKNNKTLVGFIVEDIKQKKTKKGKKFFICKATDGVTDVNCYLFNEAISFEPGEAVIAVCRSSDFGLQIVEVKAHAQLQ